VRACEEQKKNNEKEEREDVPSVSLVLPGYELSGENMFLFGST